MIPFKIALTDPELGWLFFGILALFLCATLLAELFSYFRLPRVIGELAGGILLGPSGLGYVWPDAYNKMFHYFPEQGKILSFLYWFGLILLMLSAGFHLKSQSDSQDTKLLTVLFVSSTLIPALGGIVYCRLYDFTPHIGPAGTPLSMTVIVCLAVAITSIPVISKIFMDLGIIDTRFAKIVLAVAISHDIILWAVLGIVLNANHRSIFRECGVAFCSVIFLVAATIVAYCVAKFARKIVSIKLSESRSIFTIIAICLMMVFGVNMLGINIIFGALMAGVIFSGLRTGNFYRAKETISKFAISFFIPIYFAIVGLKINLPAYFNGRLVVSFLLVSSGIMLVSVIIGLKAIRETWLTCFNFAIAMMARGGPGIVLASIAYEGSLIDGELFVALVLVALITSFATGAWFRFVLNKKWPLYAEVA